MQEKCGVIGVWNVPRAGEIVRQGLMALQHRGQDGAGIYVVHSRTVAQQGARSASPTVAQQEARSVVKTEGLVSALGEVADGNSALGHTRYATVGKDTSGLQPIVDEDRHIAIAHNGQLVNYEGIREELLQGGATFNCNSDTEVILKLLAKYWTGGIDEAIRRTLSRIKGSYALCILTDEKMVAIRDPLGLRPLCLGRLGDGIVVASESCALDAVGAQFLRDVRSGEVLTINGGLHSTQLHSEGEAHCAFEYVYFARPDSDIDGVNVAMARIAMGRQLAAGDDIEADCVIGVPDSGLHAAVGYAQERKLPLELALVKNKYIARTFIAQGGRDALVRTKLSCVRAMVEGRRVVVIDDSIVRGTTAKRLVGGIKAAGAKEVHLRIASPAVKYCCYYGIDTPSTAELVAHKMDESGLASFIGCESVRFLSIASLLAAASVPCCTACFSGVYPCGVTRLEEKR